MKFWIPFICVLVVIYYFSPPLAFVLLLFVGIFTFLPIDQIVSFGRDKMINLTSSKETDGQAGEKGMVIDVHELNKKFSRKG